MLNKKGFTVVELIMSFAFVSVLTASLLAVVINYKDKEQDLSIKAELLSFKSKLTVDIQNDIQTKILDSMEHCIDASNNRISRCVKLIFKNGETKVLQIKEEIKEDYILNDDGSEEPFMYKAPYITYGDIRYTPPEAGNIIVNNTFILDYNTANDGVENGLSLYKISIDFEHVDIDADINISIVASGNKIINNAESTKYGDYSTGDRVTVQLGGTEERNFYVLQNSSTYENKLVLLSEGNIGEASNALVFGPSAGTMAFASGESGNLYENNSAVKVQLEYLANKYNWQNPDVIRLATIEEIGYLVFACPKYQEEDAPNMPLTSAPDWVLSTNSYWTMSPALYSDNKSGKYSWYVDVGEKKIMPATTDKQYGIRPVIEITKEFIIAHHIPHIVVAGDTLETLATRYNTKAKKIAEDNGLTFDSALTVGQKLWIQVDIDIID